jgi:hypothetical protein
MIRGRTATSPTDPTANVEPVMWKIWSDTAMDVTWKPRVENADPIHRRRKSGYFFNGERSMSSLAMTKD